MTRRSLLVDDVILLSARAVKALRDCLERYGEVLPVECKDGEFYLYHTALTLNALDEKSSRLERFDSGGVMEISRYVFDPKTLADAEIFKMPQENRYFIFVTDEFVHRIKKAKLKGFNFEEVWAG